MTAPPAGALEACPFCGGGASVFPPSAKRGDHPNLGGRFFPIVCCGTCFAEVQGANYDSVGTTAIAAWNRRTHGPALLAALRLREWRPIAEAPKDGRSVLIFCKGAAIPAIAFFCEGAGSWMSIAGESFAHPIMWMPAPIPTADDLARVLEQTK